MPKAIAVRGRPIDAETPADRKNNPAQFSWASRADIGSDMRISPSDSWMMSNAAMGGSTDPWAVAAADAVAADRVRKSLVESTDAGILGMPSPSGGGTPMEQELYDMFNVDFSAPYGQVDPRWPSPARNSPDAKKVNPFHKGYMTNSPYTLDFYDTKLGKSPAGQWWGRNSEWAGPVGKAVLATLLGSPAAGLASGLKSLYQEALDRFQPGNKDFNPRLSAAVPDPIERVLASRAARLGPLMFDLYTAGPTIVSAARAGR